MRLELSFTDYAHSDIGLTQIFERIESIRVDGVNRLHVSERRAKGVGHHQFRLDKIADIRLSVYVE